MAQVSYSATLLDLHVFAVKFASGIAFKVSVAAFAALECIARMVITPFYFLSNRTFQKMVTGVTSAAKISGKAMGALFQIHSPEKNRPIRKIDPQDAFSSIRKKGEAFLARLGIVTTRACFSYYRRAQKPGLSL